MFAGRNLIIATMHAKEQVIAPIFEKELGVNCFVATHFDTDVLGTFSGEKERKSDPISTALEKCKLAMQLTNCDLAIASEGSFGNHPTAYFAAADDEFMVFVDVKNKLEIVVRNLSLDTNFATDSLSNTTDLGIFADKIGFPQHKIILKNSEKNPTEIRKNATNWTALKASFLDLIKQQPVVYAETDMRAMHNPTRMKIIEQTAYKLIDKIKNECPKCHMPGFEMVDAIKGLPCENCNRPTRSAKMHLFRCKKCTFEALKEIQNNKQYEDPQYCDFCNP